MGVRPGPKSKWDDDATRKKLCDELIRRGKAGQTITAMCREMGIYTGTLYKLAARAPDVKEAIDAARSYCIGYWEQHAAELSTGARKGNVPMTIFILKNVAGWRDKAEVETSLTITLPAEAAKL